MLPTTRFQLLRALDSPTERTLGPSTLELSDEVESARLKDTSGLLVSKMLKQCIVDRHVCDAVGFLGAKGRGVL